MVASVPRHFGGEISHTYLEESDCQYLTNARHSKIQDRNYSHDKSTEEQTLANTHNTPPSDQHPQRNCSSLQRSANSESQRSKGEHIHSTYAIRDGASEQGGEGRWQQDGGHDKALQERRERAETVFEG